MSDAIPVLFTLGGSRHEVILVSPSKATLEGLKNEIVNVANKSPNCKQVMAEYGRGEDEVEKISVRWNAHTHDPKIYPASTVLTENNFEATIKMIAASGIGRDTLEVKFDKAKEEEKK